MSDLDDARQRYDAAVQARINAAKKTDVNEGAAGTALANYSAALLKEVKARKALDAALEASGQPRLPALMLPTKSKRVI